jgi:hypothetical protein
MRVLSVLSILGGASVGSAVLTANYQDSGCTDCWTYDAIVAYCKCTVTPPANPAVNNRDTVDCTAGKSSWGTLTAWQKYTCSSLEWGVSRASYPQKRWPRANDKCKNNANYKGIIVGWHGYSASPDQHNQISDMLQDECFDVFNPTYPGHGQPIGENRCRDKAVTAGSCLNGTTDVADVPNNRHYYEKFIDVINSALYIERDRIAKERGLNPWDIEVASMGLSLGGAMAVLAPALHAVNNPNTDSAGKEIDPKKRFYTKILSINAFHGISVLDADRGVTSLESCLMATGKYTDANTAAEAIKVCLGGMFKNAGLTDDVQAKFIDFIAWLRPDVSKGWQGFQSNLRSILTGLAEGTAVIPASLKDKFQALIGLKTGWGDMCAKQTYQSENGGGRGGICWFTVLHLLACHSTGDFAITAARYLPPGMKIQFMTVERDGNTRNGLALQTAKNALSTTSNIQMCMYRFIQGCTKDANECAVPHSSLSYKDNAPQGPIWWQTQSLYPKIVKFMKSSWKDTTDQVGDAADKWDPTIGTQCISSPGK